MDDSATPPCQLADERQRDDALATAGPTGHRDHPLSVPGTRVFHRMHNQVHRQLLISDQPELRAVTDLRSGKLQQLFRRRHGRVDQQISRLAPGDRSKP